MTEVLDIVEGLDTTAYQGDDIQPACAPTDTEDTGAQLSLWALTAPQELLPLYKVTQEYAGWTCENAHTRKREFGSPFCAVTHTADFPALPCRSSRPVPSLQLCQGCEMVARRRLLADSIG